MERKGRCLIISGGTEDIIPCYEPEADLIIACDRGYEYARRKGIRPDLAIGDFDSCTVKIESAVKQLIYPKEKDDTDTMLAVRKAAEEGFSQVEICCALGGRLDHTVANLQALAFAAENGLEGSITGKDSQIYMIKGEKTICLLKKEGWSLSVFSFSDWCRHVRIKGTKYLLEDGTLTNRFPIGVSNQWEEEKAEISLKEGLLCIILSNMEGEKAESL